MTKTFKLKLDYIDHASHEVFYCDDVNQQKYVMCVVNDSCTLYNITSVVSYEVDVESLYYIEPTGSKSLTGSTVDRFIWEHILNGALSIKNHYVSFLILNNRYANEKNS